MSEEKTDPVQPEEKAEEGKPSRFAELDELQEQTQKRIRDNQRFLERFMDDDFEDEVAESDEDGEDDEPFEEL